MKFGQRFVRVLTALLTSLVFLCGCDASVLDRKVVFTTGFAADEVFRIEDVSCSLSEIMLYLVNTQMGYENTFGSDIWSKQTDSGTVEDRLKDSVLAKVAQIKVMNLLARENGIELDESEEELAGQAALDYYDGLSESDINLMNSVSAEDIAGIMRERALADKLYDYIIRDINPEISDDEARTITVEQIFVKTYSVDEAGNKVMFTEGQKVSAYDRIRQAQIKIWNGENFEDLVGLYNEADESIISFGKGEMDSAYEDAAFNLGTDEISGIVETSDGYAIIRCMSTFNREETEVNKVRIVEQRKRQVFGDQYDAFVATLTKELNTKLWDSVSLVEGCSDRAGSLMEIYDKYFD